MNESAAYLNETFLNIFGLLNAIDHANVNRVIGL